MPNNEFGDFQTPVVLAEQCLRVLGLASPARVLEPTCGVGGFLEAAYRLDSQTERHGIEIQSEYLDSARAWGFVSHANIFEVDLETDIPWHTDAPLFVIGNPPWVTSADLNRLGSENLPTKENFKGAKGLDALLGSSNFDVCEYIILKCLGDLRKTPLRLGMLCKTQVARNVVEHAFAIGLPVTGCSLYRIDAKRWFNAAVDACFFVVTLDPSGTSVYVAEVFDDVFVPEVGPSSRFGIVEGRLVADVDRYLSVRHADGKSTRVWRSGLKHDASDVFELDASPEPSVDLEPEYLFPLLKCTDVFRGNHRRLRKWVLVPQMTFGADTAHLKHTAPRVWAYLIKNSAKLDGRRSSIYRNRPRFSVFGLGDYTYAPYKVAVSGLHKEAVFRLVGPISGKPVVLDDTCYFLPFGDPTEAAVVATKLNSTEAKSLIESLVFWDSKRPITKKLLSRVDLDRLMLDEAKVIAEARALAREASIPFDEERARALVGAAESPDWKSPALF